MERIPAYTSNRYRQPAPMWSVDTSSIHGRRAGRELPRAGPGAHRPAPRLLQKDYKAQRVGVSLFTLA